MEPAARGQEDEEDEDNGERVQLAHLKVFMAAILGFSIGTQAKFASPSADLIGTIDERTGEYMLT